MGCVHLAWTVTFLSFAQSFSHNYIILIFDEVNNPRTLRSNFLCPVSCWNLNSHSLLFGITVTKIINLSSSQSDPVLIVLNAIRLMISNFGSYVVKTPRF